MSINKVMLIGNVGKDPDVRYLDNGVAVANFTIATTERGYTAANGTQVPDRTEWHNIVLWRGLAEIAEKYVRKGTKLYIEGKIRTRSYDGSDGNKRYVTEIWGDNLELLGSKPTDNAGRAPHPSETMTATEAPKPQTPRQETPAAPVVNDDPDDLPF
jgi:single stranded DNA-binding protein (ssb)